MLCVLFSTEHSFMFQSKCFYSAWTKDSISKIGLMNIVLWNFNVFNIDDY